MPKIGPNILNTSNLNNTSDLPKKGYQKVVSPEGDVLYVKTRRTSDFTPAKAGKGLNLAAIQNAFQGVDFDNLKGTISRGPLTASAKSNSDGDMTVTVKNSQGKLVATASHTGGDSSDGLAWKLA